MTLRSKYYHGLRRKHPILSVMMELCGMDGYPRRKKMKKKDETYYSTMMEAKDFLEDAFIVMDVLDEDDYDVDKVKDLLMKLLEAVNESVKGL